MPILRLLVLELSILLLQLLILSDDLSLRRLLLSELHLVLRFILHYLCLRHLITIALFLKVVLRELHRFFDLVQLVPGLHLVALIVRDLLHQGLE